MIQLLVSAILLSAGAAHPQSKPDVFLITIDTLRADHIHCYGYEHISTPALDGLAKDGIRFAQAFTPSPITNSSHTTILTGLLPSSHGVTDFGIPLAASHQTLAEMLKRNGYQTAAFIGAVVLDSRSLAPGLDRGFDFYDNFPEHFRTRSRWGRVERRGIDVVGRAEAWLRKHSSGPDFVWVHLYDPHDPYQPPPPYDARYKGQLYDGEIAYADSAVAHFVSYLKTIDRYQNSLIIVVGDHGEGLGEHNEATHGIFLYDSTTHVPLIAKLPGNQRSAMVVADQVRTTDIFPTVLDLLGIAAPTQLDGQALRPYLNGGNPPARIVLGETDYPLRFGWAPLRSVRADGYKFIEAPRPELYDLRSDPRELNNHYQPWDANVKKSRSLLADQRAKAPKQQSEAAVGANTLDELKALGYLGQADAVSSTTVPEPSLLPDPKDKIEEQNLLHDAMLAIEDNRQADARRSLEKILQMDNDSFAALRQLGELEASTGLYRLAAEHFKHAHDLHPNDASVTLSEARALFKSGDLAGAKSILESAPESTPAQLDGRLLLGKIYLQMKDATAARDQFQAAQLLQPDSLEAGLGLAKVSMEEHDFQTALAQLEPLSKSHPESADVFSALAKALRALGKPEAANRGASRADELRRTTHRQN